MNNITNNIDSKLILWLRIILTRDIGPNKFWKIIKKGSYCLKDFISESEVEDFISKHSSVKIIPEFDPLYPCLLKQCPDRPPVIYAIGNTERLNAKSVAVVGSRRASIHAINWAYDLGALLSEHCINTVSGLARGVDKASHEGAIINYYKNNHQKYSQVNNSSNYQDRCKSITIAVLAGGVDVIYPTENQSTYEKIKDVGCIISEEPLGVQPRFNLFPKRNRIIAGLCQSTIVIEAAIKSGSLITARFALEYDRQVFAVPGSPWDPRSRGCNELIKQGAMLFDNFNDLLEQNFIENNQKYNTITAEEHGDEKQRMDDQKIEDNILNFLSYTPISISKLNNCLSENFDINSENLLNILGELEVKGKIIFCSGGFVSLK